MLNEHNYPIGDQLLTKQKRNIRTTSNAQMSGINRSDIIRWLLANVFVRHVFIDQ